MEELVSKDEGPMDRSTRKEGVMVFRYEFLQYAGEPQLIQFCEDFQCTIQKDKAMFVTQ